MNLHNRDRRRGITGVWVALMGSLMVVFLGLAIDTSYVVRTIQELQIAADSAALAGAAQVKTDIDVARAQAKLLAFNNTAGMTNGVRDEVVLALNSTNDTAGDIVTGRWYRWDDNTTDPPRYAGDFVETTVLGEINALKVVARRIDDPDPEAQKTSLPLLFGSLFGWATVDLEVDAIAMSVGTTGAGLLVLCPDCACSLEFSGDTSMTLTTAEGYEGDASIVVDSNATGCNNNAAVCGHGSSLNIDAQEINIVAEGPEYACFNDYAIVPPLNPGSPYVYDPLKDLPEPTINYAADRGCIGSSGCVKLCDAGPSVGTSCVSDADCPDGMCPGGLVACEGGSNDGYACMDVGDCPGGGMCKLVPQECYGGANADMACIDHADCAGELCLKTVRAHSGYYSGGFRTTPANSNLILDAGVYGLDNVSVDGDAGPRAGLVVRGGHFDASAGVMLHIVGNGVVDLAGSGRIIINPIDDETNIYWGVSIFQSRTNYNEARIIGTNDMFLNGTYYFPHNALEIGGTGIAVGNQLIAWTLWMHGNGEYTINYDGRNPAPGYKVFLVE